MSGDQLHNDSQVSAPLTARGDPLPGDPGPPAPGPRGPLSPLSVRPWGPAAGAAPALPSAGEPCAAAAVPRLPPLGVAHAPGESPVKPAGLSPSSCRGAPSTELPPPGTRLCPLGRGGLCDPRPGRRGGGRLAALAPRRGWGTVTPGAARVPARRFSPPRLPPPWRAPPASPRAVLISYLISLKMRMKGRGGGIQRPPYPPPPNKKKKKKGSRRDGAADGVSLSPLPADRGGFPSER